MSVAYHLLPGFDWASTTTIRVPGAETADARTWGAAIFDVHSVPWWGKVAFGAREVAAFVLRIPRGNPSMLAVREVRDGEAIIDTDDKHLHFVAGIRALDDRVDVTTVVRFKGARGRLYFVPVRFVHDQLTRTMMHAAAKRLVG